MHGFLTAREPRAGLDSSGSGTKRVVAASAPAACVGAQGRRIPGRGAVTRGDEEEEWEVIHC